jgi:hypothetical protein
MMQGGGGGRPEEAEPISHRFGIAPVLFEAELGLLICGGSRGRDSALAVAKGAEGESRGGFAEPGANDRVGAGGAGNTVMAGGIAALEAREHIEDAESPVGIVEEVDELGER